MFKIGELIVYGNTGVCRVEGIGPSALAGADKSKDYYSLAPYYSGRSKIFIPCDNNKVVMRSIISREEAVKLIEDIPDISTIPIESEKEREIVYKSAIRGCDCREIISLIKTIHCRMCRRVAAGKKVTANDEKYISMAEDKLAGELAIVLETSKEKVLSSIKEKVEENS